MAPLKDGRVIPAHTEQNAIIMQKSDIHNMGHVAGVQLSLCPPQGRPAEEIHLVEVIPSCKHLAIIGQTDRVDVRAVAILLPDTLPKN